ncbi:hypothetical protein BDV59DRAFT_169757 [Aspergillus ambiguus]|uniref:uncharacterized protein n=1 Tax=Aspergillus ambiguus TaxID=176160 RepID=UPI003CCDF8A8
MAAFALGGNSPIFRGGRNNQGIYAVFAVLAGGLILHRWYSSSFPEKDALPFPYSTRSDKGSDAQKTVKKSP